MNFLAVLFSVTALVITMHAALVHAADTEAWAFRHSSDESPDIGTATNHGLAATLTELYAGQPNPLLRYTTKMGADCSGTASNCFTAATQRSFGSSDVFKMVNFPGIDQVFVATKATGPALVYMADSKPAPSPGSLLWADPADKYSNSSTAAGEMIIACAAWRPTDGSSGKVACASDSGSSTQPHHLWIFDSASFTTPTVRYVTWKQMKYAAVSGDYFFACGTNNKLGKYNLKTKTEISYVTVTGITTANNIIGWFGNLYMAVSSTSGYNILRWEGVNTDTAMTAAPTATATSGSGTKNLHGMAGVGNYIFVADNDDAAPGLIRYSTQDHSFNKVATDGVVTGSGAGLKAVTTNCKYVYAMSVQKFLVAYDSGVSGGDFSKYPECGFKQPYVSATTPAPNATKADDGISTTTIIIIVFASGVGLLVVVVVIGVCLMDGSSAAGAAAPSAETGGDVGMPNGTEEVDDKGPAQNPLSQDPANTHP